MKTPILGFDRKPFDAYMQKMQPIFNQQTAYVLESFVAQLVNHAKESAGYKDRTTNLKTSIGGAVFFDGQVVSMFGFNGETPEAIEQETDMDTLERILSYNPTGFGIVLMAGMHYASYVEDRFGLNVLEKTKLKAMQELPTLLKKLRTQIEEAQ